MGYEAKSNNSKGVKMKTNKFDNTNSGTNLEILPSGEYDRWLAGNVTVTRYPVFGGWVVGTICNHGGRCTSSTVFVPDYGHDWGSVDKQFMAEERAVA